MWFNLCACLTKIWNDISLKLHCLTLPNEKRFAIMELFCQINLYSLQFFILVRELYLYKI